MANSSKVLKCEGYRWSGIELQDYKERNDRFKDVTRQTLLGNAAGEECLAFIARYFEVAPGGYTTLEHHRHQHAVVVLRGSGTVVLGDDTVEISELDCVHVAPNTVHQFRATGEEPLGFMCIVNRIRDRPTPVVSSLD